MQCNLKKNSLILGVTLCLVISLSACNRAIEVPYTEVSSGTTKDDLIEQLGGKADKKKDEDGLVSYQYSKSKYLDYEGTMTYYLCEDTVAFSRWEYETENKEECKKAYHAIMSDLKKQYNEGSKTEDNTGTTTIWNTDTKNITLVYTDNEELGNTVSITSIDASAGGTKVTETQKPEITKKPVDKKKKS